MSSIPDPTTSASSSTAIDAADPETSSKHVAQIMTCEDFNVSINTGTYDDTSEKPLTLEALSTITIHAVNRLSLLEWSGTLEQCSRELEDGPTDRHTIFTRANIVHHIKSCIARKNVKIMYAEQTGMSQQDDEDDLPITVIFEADTIGYRCYPIRMDKLALTLEPVVRQITEEVSLTQMAKLVKKQDKKIARLARIISTYHDFARAIEINERVTRIAVRYGQLSERMFNLAKRVIAAEIDGSPIIFNVLGCDAPIWLRSVIRFANVCDPVMEGNESRASQHIPTGPLRCYGGNEMSSSPISLSDWIQTRSHDCMCKILVIMPISENYVKNKSYLQVFNDVHTTTHTVAPCAIPIVLFGNPFNRFAEQHAYYREMVEGRVNFIPWLKECKSVRVVQLDFDDDKPTKFINQYNYDIAREYGYAIDAKDKIDPSCNKWIYPMRIVSVTDDPK